jgi:hypothetical protein
MSPQPIKISTAADVLDVLPAFLGFYPTESLCALALDNASTGGQTVALTARMDLPTIPETLAQVSANLTRLLERYPTCVLVAYSLDTQAARTTMTHLLGILDPTTVLTAVIAGPQGWTHLDPHSPTVVQWTNPYTLGPAAAQAAAAGLYAHGTRDDLRDAIAAPDPASVHAFEQAYLAENLPTTPTAAQTTRMAEEVAEYVRGYLTHPATITTDDAAYLTARVQHLHPRDTAWSLMDRATGRQHAALWRGVAALTPDQAVALPVLALLGMAGWISGEGVLATLAIERAETIPEAAAYSMLGLLSHVIDQAVPPTAWDQMVTDLRRLL